MTHQEEKEIGRTRRRLDDRALESEAKSHHPPGLLQSGIAEDLARTLDGEPIHFVGLGANEFQVAFAGIRRIQTSTKAVFSLRGHIYRWEDGPSELPVWLLVGQIPTGFEVPSPFALRINLASGDWVEFYCDASARETLIVEFSLGDGTTVIEVL